MGFSSIIGASSVIRPGVCTSTTRPSSPYDGQVIYETDTDRTMVYNGSGWVQLSTGTANPPGLELVKTQTIGTTVSTVTVSDAFNATYENYRIVIGGGVSSASSVEIRGSLGSSTSGYYGNLLFGRPSNSSPSGVANSNIANWQYLGIATSLGFFATMELYGPFMETTTAVVSHLVEFSTTGANGVYQGYHNSAVSYSSITFSPASGTLTGGTIRVYGYRNS